MKVTDKYLLALVVIGLMMFANLYNISQLEIKSLNHTNRHLGSFKKMYNPTQEKQISNIVKSKDGISYKVPAFLILGVMKAGSTLLTSLLQNHPQIPGQPKERHFFDWNKRREEIQRYQTLFKNTAQVNFSMETGTSEFITFDSTPSYFTLTYIAPSVKKICPWVKMIVILRNPVDRLFSHYSHMKRTREEYRNQTFEIFVQNDIDRLTELRLISKTGSNLDISNDAAWEEYINGKKVNNIAQKRTNTAQKNTHLEISVARGLYSIQLRQWYKYFPNSSFLVLNFDELTGENGYQSVYNKATEFLGLENIQKESFTKLVQGKGIYDDVGMKAETKKMLYDIYAPYNRELSALLGNEWNGIWEYEAKT